MRRLLVACLLVAPALTAPAPAEDAPAPTPEERRRMAEELFDRRDKNRDGALRGDELPAPAWLDRYDRDGDDAIARRELLDVTDRGPGFDRLFVIRDPRARARNALAQFDQDKDGRVAEAEYPGEVTVFERADRDRDGFLSPKELLRLAENEIDDIRRRAKNPGRGEFLGLFDLNGDRQVALAEYDGPARAFRKYDENGDDVVDYYELYPQRRPMEEEAARNEPEDLDALRTLDADQDGRVSRAEWKGTDSAWRRLDRNGDGWITSADAR